MRKATIGEKMEMERKGVGWELRGMTRGGRRRRSSSNAAIGLRDKR